MMSFCNVFTSAFTPFSLPVVNTAGIRLFVDIAKLLLYVKKTIFALISNTSLKTKETLISQEELLPEPFIECKSD